MLPLLAELMSLDLKTVSLADLNLLPPDAQHCNLDVVTHMQAFARAAGKNQHRVRLQIVHEAHAHDHGRRPQHGLIRELLVGQVGHEGDQIDILDLAFAFGLVVFQTYRQGAYKNH